ncbi:hypothetical protein J3A64_003773 [Pseudarthrobacter sp. PvP004]|nr:hypothetical protein [Pseudarthrobacter sp. PvP004]
MANNPHGSLVELKVGFQMCALIATGGNNLPLRCLAIYP